jgi:next-to-BRCA1 protein 1
LIATFVSDETFPDVTEIVVGSTFHKVWKMRNDGNCAWPEKCRLMFVSGSRDIQFELENVTPGAVKPSEEVSISVKMTAPSKQGRFASYFRLQNGDGVQFGHRIWVDIITIAAKVEAPAPAPVTVASSPIPQPQPQKPVLNNNNNSSAPYVSQWEESLRKMEEMGLSDRARNLQALFKHNGDLVQAIVELIHLDEN